MKKITLVLGLLSLIGCSGKLYTHTKLANVCDKEEYKERYSGVIYYPRIAVEDKYIQDKILNSKGELTHFMNGPDGKSCAPTGIIEKKIAPDMCNPRLLQYDTAIFESSTFSVELNADGTLSKVGTSSTSGGKSLVDSIVSIATTVKLLNHGHKQQAVVGVTQDKSLPLCSHGKISVPSDFFD